MARSRRLCAHSWQNTQRPPQLAQDTGSRCARVILAQADVLRSLGGVSPRGAHLLWQQCVGGCSRDVVAILPRKPCLELAAPLKAVQAACRSQIPLADAQPLNPRGGSLHVSTQVPSLANLTALVPVKRLRCGL